MLQDIGEEGGAVRRREGHGVERCEGSGGSERVQGQWRGGYLWGLGERQTRQGSVLRGEWVLDSASGTSVLQGWGARYRFFDAPGPYEHGQYDLDENGQSVLTTDTDVDLPEAHSDALEQALEQAAQAAARGERAVRTAAAREG